MRATSLKTSSTPTVQDSLHSQVLLKERRLLTSQESKQTLLKATHQTYHHHHHHHQHHHHHLPPTETYHCFRPTRLRRTGTPSCTFLHSRGRRVRATQIHSGAWRPRWDLVLRDHHPQKHHHHLNPGTPPTQRSTRTDLSLTPSEEHSGPHPPCHYQSESRLRR